MFLETEATFLYCNWSIEMARTIWFGSTSVVHSWQRLGRLHFQVYVKVGYSFKQKHILKLASKRKTSAKKNVKINCRKYGLHQYLPHGQQYSVSL